MTRLQKVRAEVCKISRQYGNPGIEPGIFELVAALRYCGFNTSGSCGGHNTTKEFWLYPWVLIQPTLPDPYAKKRSKRRTKQYMDAWHAELARLQNLVSFFNASRYGTGKTRRRYPHDEQVTYEGGTTLLVRLMPEGGKCLELLPQELISKRKANQILKRYRRVMREFAEFLIAQHDTQVRKGRP